MFRWILNMPLEGFGKKYFPGQENMQSSTVTESKPVLLFKLDIYEIMINCSKTLNLRYQKGNSCS